MSAMARLNRTWWSNTNSFTSKFKLHKSLLTSILLFGCETWTLLADSEYGIQAFETKCMRKLLYISYIEHKTNDWMRSKINLLVGPQEPLLATIKKWKLAWFRQVTCNDSLSKTIFAGTLQGRRCYGWYRKCWMTTSKSGHPCSCKNCSQWPPAEKTGREPLLNHLSCHPNKPIGQGTELNFSECCSRLANVWWARCTLWFNLTKAIRTKSLPSFLYIIT